MSNLEEMGLKVEKKLTFTEWKKLGRTVGTLHNSSGWWIGDWVNYGENVFGEKYAQAVDETGLSNERLRVCAWVANRYTRTRRRRELSFEAHRELAYIPDDDAQDKALDLAIKNGWGAREIREWKQKERGTGNRHTPIYRVTFEVESPLDEDEFDAFVEELEEVALEMEMKLGKITRPSEV